MTKEEGTEAMNEVQQTELTEAEARELTEKIQKNVGELKGLILTAWSGRVWVSLGYGSWHDWCDGELNGFRPQFPREERREIVTEFRDAGMSQRAIGSAVGVSPYTVNKDLAGVRNQTPDSEPAPAPAPARDPFATEPLDDPEPPRITGTDGKSYAPKPVSVQGPVWSAEESAMKDRAEAGETVVASLRGEHKNLIRWAEQNSRYVRIDRRTPWGNPFELPQDGDRDTVIKNYAEHYLPHKPSLLNRLEELRGRVLGCWCAPEPCHGDVLKAEAER